MGDFKSGRGRTIGALVGADIIRPRILVRTADVVRSNRAADCRPYRLFQISVEL